MFYQRNLCVSEHQLKPTEQDSETHREKPERYLQKESFNVYKKLDIRFCTITTVAPLSGVGQSGNEPAKMTQQPSAACVLNLAQ